MKNTLSVEEVINYITTEFDGIVSHKTWGEFSFFYNLGYKLPKGVYFCTIKEKDGENDKASHLNRAGIFRLNFELPSEEFIARFGSKPSRPRKGCAIQGSWDFTQIDRLTPHPIYGWMGWVAVLNPSSKTFEQCKPLLQLAYNKSIEGYSRRVK
jgi:hypothetical protein